MCDFRFVNGLGEVGKDIQAKPAAWKGLFMYKPSELTSDAFYNLFTPVRSVPDSNRYTAERRTLTHWRDFLIDLEGKV